MMKWLRALISKNDLTSLKIMITTFQKIYGTLITIMMMFFVRLITIVIMPITKENAE